MKTKISYFFTLIIMFLVCSSPCNAQNCSLNLSNPKQIAYTLTVDQSGRGNFTSIQSAVDSIPHNNNRWIRIQISSGTYKEKVTVPVEKPCLFFQGANRKSTNIEWGDYEDINTSPTVSFFANNILVTGIAFKNTFNFDKRPPLPAPWKPAVSVRIDGDKVAFYDCAFYGIQDTIWDKQGRHYFHNCYIEGSVDFIFGDARSIYEKCHLFVNIGRYQPNPGLGGWITAQGSGGYQDTGGFVFKYCIVDGVGKTRLGRAWGAYATVIFDDCFMSDVVDPVGWDAWNYKGHESKLTFVEVSNRGPGASTTNRVKWIKKLDGSQLRRFLDMSFISPDGWIERLPLSNVQKL